MNENMTIKDYEKLYDMILDMSYDTEEFNLESFTDEEIEKAKWIKAMFETLEDVPMGRARWIERQTKTVLESPIY